MWFLAEAAEFVALGAEGVAESVGFASAAEMIAAGEEILSSGPTWSNVTRFGKATAKTIGAATGAKDTLQGIKSKMHDWFGFESNFAFTQDEFGQGGFVDFGDYTTYESITENNGDKTIDGNGERVIRPAWNTNNDMYARLRNNDLGEWKGSNPEAEFGASNSNAPYNSSGQKKGDTTIDYSNNPYREYNAAPVTSSSTYTQPRTSSTYHPEQAPANDTSILSADRNSSAAPPETRSFYVEKRKADYDINNGSIILGSSTVPWGTTFSGEKRSRI